MIPQVWLSLLDYNFLPFARLPWVCHSSSVCNSDTFCPGNIICLDPNSWLGPSLLADIIHSKVLKIAVMAILLFLL